jgi:opacity protein-like surface antigen
MTKILSLSSLPALVLLSASMISSTPAAAEFYAGVNVGYESLRAKRTEDAGSGAILLANRKNTHASSLTGGPLLGYNWQLQKSSFFGLEIHANADRLRNRIRITVDPALAANTDILSTFERKYAYGASLRAGTEINGFIPYLKAGIEASRFRYTLKEFRAGSTRQSISHTSTKVAFVPGIGIGKRFANLETRLEYTYSIYPSIKHSFLDADRDRINQGIKSLRVHGLRAVLTYAIK